MRHVIVGAGPAGVVAAETLRTLDAGATITLVGDEHCAPYSRMAIPYLLARQIGEDGLLLRKEPGHFERLQIEYLQQEVTAVDTARRRVHLRAGTSAPYDRLLVASGSRPHRPAILGLDGPGVHPCWTLEDARAIDRLAAEKAHAVVLGAGFIGSIVLNALHARGTRVTVVETEDRMVPRMMDEPAGLMLKRWCERQGVRVLTSTRISRVVPGRERRFRLEVLQGQPLEADLVVVATGVRPRMDFLAGTGIQTADGVLVNEYLETSVPAIYAAGDVAEGLEIGSGRFAVHPIQPTSVEHGRVAALNMAGVRTPYQGSLIMNVLDTMGLVSCSFGRWMGVPGAEHAARIDTERFVYTRLEFHDDRLAGGIVVGRSEKVGVLRGLIQSKVNLGPWKARLLQDPSRFAEAYVGRIEAGHAPLRARQAG